MFCPTSLACVFDSDQDGIRRAAEWKTTSARRQRSTFETRPRFERTTDYLLTEGDQKVR